MESREESSVSRVIDEVVRYGVDAIIFQVYKIIDI